MKVKQNEAEEYVSSEREGGNRKKNLMKWRN